MAITNKTIQTNKGFNVTHFEVDSVALDNTAQAVTITASGYVNAEVATDKANAVYSLETIATAQQDPQLYAAVIAYAESKVSAKIDAINALE